MKFNSSNCGLVEVYSVNEFTMDDVKYIAVDTESNSCKGCDLLGDLCWCVIGCRKRNRGDKRNIHWVKELTNDD